ncbi:Cytochrome b [Kaistia soli DSM 19436]|uniref:Cytochrome b n=1 Tax=Kaistia soli DSM 19436 TaxID=1122133 RepID=A0A1M4YX28_9HYPH|nr:cytochrome b/b6 domain-containing protein [Kaistia soli]SHF10107.1 Cytochrome b [Kaistia soli DSM 19436]
MSGEVKVWDPVVRLFHWALAISIAIAWLTAEDMQSVHHVAGYVAAGLLAVRIVWGVIGPRTARFSSFVRHPSTVIGYLCDIAAGRERRFLGHNPAGGAMIVALMLAIAAQATMGYLLTTDAFFGVDWLAELHGAFAYVILGLIGLHVAGVLIASVRHRENLPLAMITGRKRGLAADEMG